MKITYRADSVELEGYVVAFKRDSRPLFDNVTRQYFYEQILPGVFDSELRTKEIPVLLDHIHGRQIGTSRTNFEFAEDTIGLKVKAVISDPEVMKKAKEGKLTGWSFAFTNSRYKTEALSDDEIAAGTGPVIRKKLCDMTLWEISLIDDRKIPCYEGTLVSVIDTQEEGSISAKSESGITTDEAYKIIAELEKNDKSESGITTDGAYKRLVQLEINSYKSRIKALAK